MFDPDFCRITMLQGVNYCRPIPPPPPLFFFSWFREFAYTFEKLPPFSRKLVRAWYTFSSGVSGAFDITSGSHALSELSQPDTSMPRWNSRHFADDVSNVISLGFWLKFYTVVQLITSHHWLRYWLGAEQATSHYLNQWRPSLLVYWRICVTRPQSQCVKIDGLAPNRRQTIIYNNM